MASTLVTQVDKPFLVLPTQPAQSLLAQPQKSWAQQQIANQGGNTMSWLPSTANLQAPTQSKQTLSMGGMTVDLLPTDDPATRQSLPVMVQRQTAAQAAQYAQTISTPVQPVQASNSDIQTSLQAGAVDVLGMGIFETPATAFAFANPSTEISPYVLYGVVALVACVVVYYLYRENYI
jgi:cobalamin biosynthesis Mg chelatase CobN